MLGQVQLEIAMILRIAKLSGFICTLTPMLGLIVVLVYVSTFDGPTLLGFFLPPFLFGVAVFTGFLVLFCGIRLYRDSALDGFSKTLWLLLVVTFPYVGLPLFGYRFFLRNSEIGIERWTLALWARHKAKILPWVVSKERARSL